MVIRAEDPSLVAEQPYAIEIYPLALVCVGPVWLKLTLWQMALVRGALKRVLFAKGLASVQSW